MSRLEDSTLETTQARQSETGTQFLCLTLLCHPELTRVGETAKLFDLARPGKVTISRSDGVFRGSDGSVRGPLSTVRMSRLALSIEITPGGAARLEAPADAGVFVGGRPLSGALLVEQDVLTRGTAVRCGKYVVLWLSLRSAAEMRTEVPGLIGLSRAMEGLRDEIRRVADLDVPVMLRGESGVGKELVARALHDLSPRSKGPYVAVNLAAIPPSMASAELFGHSKGAFTNASVARPGYFLQADGGTLFMDEIGHAVSEVQPVLLRAVEGAGVQALGGRVRAVNVRLVAATDVDLEAAVARGSFHGALLRRFGYDIRVPALRERPEDIGVLFAHFLALELRSLQPAGGTGVSVGNGPPVPAEFIERLLAHSFPGNVRELRNVVRRFAISNRGRDRAVIDDALTALIGLPKSTSQSAVAPSRGRGRTRTLATEQIVLSLERNAYHVDRTASDLGVSRVWLHKRMGELGLMRRAKDLSRKEAREALEACGWEVARAALTLRVSAHGLRLHMARLRLKKPS